MVKLLEIIYAPIICKLLFADIEKSVIIFFIVFTRWNTLPTALHKVDSECYNTERACHVQGRTYKHNVLNKSRG
jgi:hypothetical protein